MATGGRLVRKLRHLRGISMSELGRRSNLSHAVISRIERQLKGYMPDRDSVEGIIAALRPTPEEADELRMFYGFAPMTNWKARAEVAEAEVRRLKEILRCSEQGIPTSGVF